MIVCRHENLALRRCVDSPDYYTNSCSGELPSAWFRTATGADYKLLFRDKLGEIQSKHEVEMNELVKKYETQLADKPAPDPDVKAIVESLVLAAQNSPMSIELERATAAGVVWLEKQNLKEGD